jgi:hypothetical protein
MTPNHANSPEGEKVKAVALEDLAGFDREALIQHVVSDYGTDRSAVEPFEFICAYESVGSWGCDSSSFFLLKRDGKLFEVNGSHCSCYGFEDQWKPEETSKDALLRRSYIGLGGYDNHPEENRKAILDAIEATP